MEPKQLPVAPHVIHVSSKSSKRRDDVLRGVMQWSDAEPASTEVTVKNTFIHVVDKAPPLVRSMSDSDIGSGSSRSRTTSTSSSYDDFELTPGAASSSGAGLRVAGKPFLAAPPRSAEEEPTGQPPSDYEDVPDVPNERGEEAEAEAEAEDEAEDENPGEWTIGASKHSIGGCRPCSYYKAGTCTNGENCRFCHMVHQKKFRARPCKAKRAQAKQVVAMMAAIHKGSPQELAEDLCNASAAVGATFTEQSYLRSVVVSRARSNQQENTGEQQASASASAKETAQPSSSSSNTGGQNPDAMFRMKL